MLLIPTKKKCKNKKWKKTKKNLYGISSNIPYTFKLPVPYDKRLCGSSHGWLAKVDSSSKVTLITLFNPFKDAAVSITLPPIYFVNLYRRRKRYEYDVHKVILSANPTFKPHDYVVVAIYSMRKCLAFLKAGQKNWTYIDDIHRLFNDVIFYKGLVYAVGLWNNIVSFDLSDLKDGRVVSKVVSLKRDDYADRVYLVKSLEGDLWLVRKFIGYHASYFSNYLQKDSIYYTDDFYEDTPPYPNGPFDMKIYNVKDKRFSQHCPFYHWFKENPPAVWVIPPFQ
ncbi:uncharacterized protein LOC131658073 [Vicia villosa]|uniref:uncharacterized protein LOC131658073 n=1 Tax=Vicia villosa TaxID=3911 RepID=UPI00273B4DC5|nr:uncharacterized protein LOC131658073 [Vicia villosa]